MIKKWLRVDDDGKLSHVLNMKWAEGADTYK